MRTMRIVPWNQTDAPHLRGYTLILEWWRDGEVIEDRRFQMNEAEFLGLRKSVNEQKNQPKVAVQTESTRYVMMLERAGDHQDVARVILFQQERSGARCVMDIAENDFAYYAVEIAVDKINWPEIWIENEDGTQHKAEYRRYSTKRARIKCLLRVLEHRYKTGLNLDPPKRTRS